MEKLEIKNSIIIDSSPDVVWKALTDPSQTKVYMFGCEAVSDWKSGSTLLWRGNYEGKEMIFVKGHIKEIVKPHKLSYTAFDPNNQQMADIAENYLTVTYDLANENGKTRLTVTQGDYNKVADGEKRYQESYNNGEGWDPILQQIKNLVEKSN